MFPQFHAVEGASKGKDEEFGKKLKSAEERALTAEQNLARAVKDFEACKTEMQQVLLGMYAFYSCIDVSLQNTQFYDRSGHLRQAIV